ncbi:sorting nexin-8 [Plakobranchus ocellatus]|uniref:Sorting nexin-8 n=1 Tax=Plakobranchus ocellatus TaxID=259542 RepID=A0AAV3Y4X6_9GAST|nr:sorting nexin-8 [Plakobranchus ocellatus]
MENRNYFSLHCLQMETQLIHAHLDIFHEFVSCMAKVEATTANDLARIWASMEPVIATLAPDDSTSTAKHRLSPLNSPTSNNNNGPGITL